MTRKNMKATLYLSDLNFPRFLVPGCFIFKANFQSNQGTIPSFLGMISGVEVEFRGFKMPFRFF